MFEDWIQERGLYFASEWDDGYVPVLELNDPGEEPRHGSMLIAPVGEGVLSFSTMDEAVSAIESLKLDYNKHSRAAREIATNFFDSGKVLTKLLERAMNVSEYPSELSG